MAQLYNCNEVAERYGVKVITVWDWIRTGKLGAMRVGKSYRISDDDLIAFENAARVGNSNSTT